MQELAFKIGSRFLKQPLVEITPILGKGRINRIFLVQAKTEEIVIRLNEFLSTPDALEGYVKEEWCLERAASVGVPGPSVLEIGQYDGQAYMIQSRVSGENAVESLTKKHRSGKRLDGTAESFTTSTSPSEKEAGKRFRVVCAALSLKPHKAVGSNRCRRA